MRYIQEVKPIKKQTAVALGLFDGVHIGHQTVMKRAVDEKKAGLTPIVLSFCTKKDIPDSKRNYAIIVTESIRCDVIRAQGIEVLMEPDFAGIKDLTPEEFVEDILINKLKAKKIFCGKNYHFGKRAAGNVELLRKIAADRAEIVLVPSVTLDGEIVSSTRIRKEIALGNIKQANRLLGYDYCFDFPVASGSKIGRTIGVPTINQIFHPRFLIPKFGVYASTMNIDGEMYYGVTNVGVKPTVHNVSFPLSETHIIGFDGDLYGRNIKVSLIDYLREEKKFDSIKTLKKVISENIEQVKDKYMR